jgi:hypothetical protein
VKCCMYPGFGRDREATQNIEARSRPDHQ